MKSSRQEKILAIIERESIETQNQLMEALAREGVKSTQATLSRDMKQLKVAKASTLNGKYVYVLPNETMYKRVTTQRLATEMMQVSGFVSINFTGNLGVIKTRPGYASSIAYNIDNSDIPEIIGTIAGDDTIFIVIKHGPREERVIESLKMVIPGMK